MENTNVQKTRSTLWLIEKNIFKYEIDLVEELRNQGYPFVLAEFSNDEDMEKYLKYLVNENPGESGSKPNTIPIGSVGFCEAIRRRTTQGFGPSGFWYETEMFNYSWYSSSLHGLILNNTAYLLPFKTFVTRYESDLANGTAKWVFVKPDSPRKNFSGVVVTPSNYYTSIACHKNDIGAFDMVVVEEKIANISQEYRVMVAGDKIIYCNAYYFSNDKRFYRPIVCHKKLHEIRSFVKVVLDTWTPRPSTFIIDVCELENGLFKVVEMNPLNSTEFGDSVEIKDIARALSNLAFMNS